MSESSKRWQKAHPAEARAQQKRWRDAHPEMVARSQRKRRLLWYSGLTEAEYDALFEAQGGLCGICKRPQSDFAKLFAADHDHRHCSGPRSCGKCVRGLLCSRCNIGLTWFSDDPTLLIAASGYVAAYVERVGSQKE